MIQRYINNKQYVCFDINELFAWQDALDEIEKEINHLNQKEEGINHISGKRYFLVSFVLFNLA